MLCNYSVQVIQRAILKNVSQNYSLKITIAIAKTFIANQSESKIRDTLQINATVAAIYLFKVNDGNTRTMYETCSELTIKTTERCQ